MPSSRTLILSDTHLGRPGASAGTAANLRPLWQGFDHLIFNGDLAEVHHPDYWATASRETLKLQEMCEADGVKLTLLSGNHDPFLSDIRHLHLAGGQVFVTHGDVIHPSITPWSPAGKKLRTAFEDVLATLPDAERRTLHARLAAAQHASHIEWLEYPHHARRSMLVDVMLRPWLAFNVLHYWWRFGDRATRFADEHAPDARYLVFGHTHRPMITDVRGRTVINTGCYGFPGTPRAVVIAGDTLSVWRIRRDSAGYVLAARSMAEFPLRQADATEELRDAA